MHHFKCSVVQSHWLLSAEQRERESHWPATRWAWRSAWLYFQHYSWTNFILTYQILSSIQNGRWWIQQTVDTTPGRTRRRRSLVVHSSTAWAARGPRGKPVRRIMRACIRLQSSLPVAKESICWIQAQVLITYGEGSLGNLDSFD